MTDVGSTPPGPQHARGRGRGRRRRLAVVVAALLVAVPACSGSSDPEAADELVTEVEVSPAPHSAHIPIVTVATSDDATVTVTATSDDHEVVTPPSARGTTHEVPVLGLRTDREYDISVTAEPAGGAVERVADTASYTTPPLPEDFPPLEVTSDPGRVAPGVTLIPFNRGFLGQPTPAAETSEGPPVPATGRLVGVDETGEVVWYYETDRQVVSVEPTPGGTLLLGIDDDNALNLDTVLREIDMQGNTLAEWSTRVGESSDRVLSGGADPTSVAIDSVHHDAHELPNGNILALSTELIELDAARGVELCPEHPVSHLVADVVVEFERSGEVVAEWPVAAGFDPLARPGNQVCEAPDTRAAEDWMYPEVERERFWTHGNAVVLDEADNALIVSLRALDAVVALRYQDDGDGAAGEILWELGPDGDLEMQGGGLFPYRQHAPELRDDGTLLLYDNGDLRPGTGEGGDPQFSRAVIYRIDPAARTVEQVWEHRDVSPWDVPTYSPILGDADTLENGNVLITHGAVLDPDLRTRARIVEVDPDVEGGGAGDEVVFDLMAGTDSGWGWAAYHAKRLPSLYPSS